MFIIRNGSRRLRTRVKKKVAEMEKFLQEAPSEITEFDDIMVRRYIKEIKIYDDRFQILFKAGIDIDVARH